MVRSEHAHASYPGLFFRRLGSAPIWGGKKGEFRDWTKAKLEQIGLDRGSSGATRAMGREGGSFPSPRSAGKLSVSGVNSPIAIDDTALT